MKCVQKVIFWDYYFYFSEIDQWRVQFTHGQQLRQKTQGLNKTMLLWEPDSVDDISLENGAAQQSQWDGANQRGPFSRSHLSPRTPDTASSKTLLSSNSIKWTRMPADTIYVRSAHPKREAYPTNHLALPGLLHFSISLRKSDHVGDEKFLQVKEGCSYEYCTYMSPHKLPV